jgi:hypothetical protein
MLLVGRRGSRARVLLLLLLLLLLCCGAWQVAAVLSRHIYRC